MATYQDTPIGRLFQASWGLSAQEILQQTKTKIINNYGAKKDFQKLENELNKLFFPTGDDSSYFAQIAAEERSEFIRKKTEGLTAALSNDLKAIINSELGQFAGTKKKDGEKRTAIKIENFELRKNQILNVIRNHKDMIDTDLVTQANALVNDMQNVLNGFSAAYGLTKTANYFRTKANSATSIFIQMDIIYNALRCFANLAEIEGEANEREQQVARTILKMGAENLTNQEIQSLMKYMYSIPKSSLYGSRLQKRDSIVDLSDIKIDLKQIPNKETQYSVSYSYQIGGEVLNLTGALGRKEGKVDIVYNTDYGNFMSSVKEWKSSFAAHDFGETSLFNGLVRAGGIKNALSYGLVISYYGSKDRLYGEYASNTQKLHQYAKACILVDTLIGKSQSHGHMADTLIIRDKTKIKVYSMTDILNKVYDNLNLLDNTNYKKKIGNVFYFQDFEKKVESELSSLSWKSTVGRKNFTTVSHTGQLNSLKAKMASFKLRTSADILL